MHANIRIVEANAGIGVHFFYNHKQFGFFHQYLFGIPKK
jgi:hypothetical protein